jgi:hypothetical protein
MSPEQFRGEVTPWTDQYSVGGTLVFLLAGIPPTSLPQRRLETDLASVKCSPGTRAILTDLLKVSQQNTLNIIYQS